MFRFGGGSPLVIFVVCGFTATKFCTEIDNQSISSNIKQNYVNLITSLEGGILLRSLLLLHILFNHAETLQKHLPFMLLLIEQLDLK